MCVCNPKCSHLYICFAGSTVNGAFERASYGWGVSHVNEGLSGYCSIFHMDILKMKRHVKEDVDISGLAPWPLGLYANLEGKVVPSPLEWKVVWVWVQIFVVQCHFMLIQPHCKNAPNSKNVKEWTLLVSQRSGAEQHICGLHLHYPGFLEREFLHHYC